MDGRRKVRLVRPPKAVGAGVDTPAGVSSQVRVQNDAALAQALAGAVRYSKHIAEIPPYEWEVVGAVDLKTCEVCRRQLPASAFGSLGLLLDNDDAEDLYSVDLACARTMTGQSELIDELESVIGSRNERLAGWLAGAWRLNDKGNYHNKHHRMTVFHTSRNGATVWKIVQDDRFDSRAFDDHVAAQLAGFVLAEKKWIDDVIDHYKKENEGGVP